MSHLRLQIIYEPPEAEFPLCVAEIRDRGAVRAAAQSAIAEAEARLKCASNPEALYDHQAEAKYVRQALTALVPGLGTADA